MVLRAWRTLRGMAVLACCGCLVSGVFAPVRAAGPAALTVTVGGIRPGGVIPGVFAFCVPANQGHTTGGPNRSPGVSWPKGPAGTASYAVVMYDTDVPTVFDTANKEGQIVSADLKRRDAYYHWVLVDIPANMTGVPEGAESTGREAKQVGPSKHGLRGAHDSAGGGRGGYDGPCPPWNDAIAHHYHFTVYALNVASLGLSGAFTGGDVARAMEGHVLAKGEVVGVYTQNPDVTKILK
jgi:Raf kinase inhibitor-like YbhB/YbcL family protein